MNLAADVGTRGALLDPAHRMYNEVMIIGNVTYESREQARLLTDRTMSKFGSRSGHYDNKWKTHYVGHLGEIVAAI